MKTKITSVFLVLALVVSLLLSGCTGEVQDLSGEFSRNEIQILDAPVKSESYMDFSLELLKNFFDGNENCLLSPLSVALALAMVTEGAEGETLRELEDVLGMDKEELRNLALNYLAENPQLSVANSLWLNDIEGLTVYDDFLQKNSNYHEAEIFKTPFSSKTVRDINAWVKENTDGLVEQVISDLDKRAVVCLVNALLFEAEWMTPYTEKNVKEDKFITEKNVTQSAEFLFSTESYYLEDTDAKGFLKYYEGGDFAFAALLPDEGVSVKDYVASLNGERLGEIFSNVQEVSVHAKMPKFESDTSLSLNSALERMGLSAAFDSSEADFSSLGKVEGGNIYIGDVAHSTKISVTEQGTKAGAATAVTVYGAGAPQDVKEVNLDRPFVYMIMDMENNLPVFMGTLMEI